MSKSDYKPVPEQDVEAQAPPAYSEVPSMSFKPQRGDVAQETEEWDIGLCGCMKDHKADFCLACCCMLPLILSALPWRLISYTVPSAAFGILSSRLQHYKETGFGQHFTCFYHACKLTLYPAHPTRGTVVNKFSGMHFGASLAAFLPAFTGLPLPLGLIVNGLEVSSDGSCLLFSSVAKNI